MTINNRNCKVDFTTNRIFVSHKFLENSQKIYSEEFRTMIELRKMLPTFRIEVMTVRMNRPKTPTYDQMRMFIEMQDEADVLLEEFHKVRMLGCTTGNAYAFVLKWFKNRFEIERDNDYFAA
jgi:maleate cis-trans isomerase